MRCSSRAVQVRYQSRDGKCLSSTPRWLRLSAGCTYGNVRSYSYACANALWPPR